MSDVPRLLSDEHGLMAVGSLSSTLTFMPGPNAGEMKLGEIEGFPEPPEWLELWEGAVAATRETAAAELRERLGASEPTTDEKLEVETIAQAHYEAYARLNADRIPEPIAWEALPDDRRALMMATVADMLASGTINVGPGAAHPKGARELWVVFAGMPGPGAKALLEEAGLAKEEVIEVVGQVPEFVEVEDAAGAGHGTDRGLRWEPHPSAEGLYRLGPFPAARARELPDREKVVALIRETIVGDVDPAKLPGASDLARKITERLIDQDVIVAWQSPGFFEKTEGDLLAGIRPGVKALADRGKAALVDADGFPLAAASVVDEIMAGTVGPGHLGLTEEDVDAVREAERGEEAPAK